MRNSSSSGLMGLGITVEADVADLRGRDQRQDAADHAEARSQDRHDRELAAGDDFKGAFDRLDKAMYASKHNGRNKVTKL